MPQSGKTNVMRLRCELEDGNSDAVPPNFSKQDRKYPSASGSTGQRERERERERVRERADGRERERGREGHRGREREREDSCRGLAQPWCSGRE